MVASRRTKVLFQACTVWYNCPPLWCGQDSCWNHCGVYHQEILHSSLHLIVSNIDNLLALAPDATLPLT